MTVFAIILGLLCLMLLGVCRHQHKLIVRVREMIDQIVRGRTPASFILGQSQEAIALSQGLEKLQEHQRQLEALILQEEFDLRAVLGSLVEGVVVIDVNHIIRLSNPAISTLFNLSESPRGCSVIEAFRQPDIEWIVTEAMATDSPQQKEILLPSNHPSLQRQMRTLQITATPLRSDGRQAGVVVLIHDITKLKQLEDLRREFVTNVSHELRTPLSIFRGYLELLIASPPQDRSELIRILQIMDRHSQRLGSLTQDLLDLSRLEAGHVTLNIVSVRLQDFLHLIVSDWTMQLSEREQTIQLEIAPDIHTIEADSKRMEQVFNNLIENASKYSPTQTTILITAQTEGHEVHITIRDQGVGIPEHDLPNIFERFYRVEKSRARDQGGTGLGLSIVKQIILAHKGRISAVSDIGKGTTIHFWLPLEHDTATSEPV